MNKKTTGIIFLALSIAGIIYSLIFKITTSGVDLMGTSTGRVVNLDLMQTKLTILILSCTMFISGVVCLAAGEEKAVIQNTHESRNS